MSAHQVDSVPLQFPLHLCQQQSTAVNPEVRIWINVSDMILIYFENFVKYIRVEHMVQQTIN